MEINKKIILELVQEYGEAFYLLDSKQFKENYLELKASFSKIYSNFNIAYSYKTNYIPKLCRIVNELGGYAEVVSEMEVELALKCGVRVENIIWNGPVKNSVVLERMLLQGAVINIDSYEELELICELAKVHRDSEFRIGLRCNYDVQDGVISRFGFDINSQEFKAAIESVTQTRNVKFVSLQCHFAKRQIEYWPARVKGMIALIDKIGIIPERVDLGGAMFGKMDESLKAQFDFFIPRYDDYARIAASAFAERFGSHGPELIVEPGSALVGDCMKFIGTVKTVKNIRGKCFVTVLGSQKNISMSGVNPPMQVIAMGSSQQYVENADIVGFTCIEGDVIYKNFSGSIAIGDAIVISNCGSYSVVMKPPFILPNFAVLDISAGESEVIKRAECFEDIFHTYSM